MRPSLSLCERVAMLSVRSSFVRSLGRYRICCSCIEPVGRVELRRGSGTKESPTRCRWLSLVHIAEFAEDVVSAAQTTQKGAQTSQLKGEPLASHL